MKYLIEVVEILSKKIEIEANSEDEAISMVKDKYKNEEIVLDYSDFLDVDFKIIK